MALKVGDLCCAAEDVTASTIVFSHIGEVVALHVDLPSNSSGKYMVDFYEGMYKKKEGMDKIEIDLHENRNDWRNDVPNMMADRMVDRMTEWIITCSWDQIWCLIAR